MDQKPEFAKEISEAMQALIAACKKNDAWKNCHEHCPFDDYCSAIEEAGYGTPDNWSQEESEEEF